MYDLFKFLLMECTAISRTRGNTLVLAPCVWFSYCVFV